MSQRPLLTLGTAPDSWGVWFSDDPRQPGWRQFLDEVVEAGYEWIELGPWGYLPTDLKVLVAEIEQRGLRVSATAVAAQLEAPDIWDSLEARLDQVCEQLRACGGRRLVFIDDCYTDMRTGAQRAPATLDDGAWSRLIDTSRRLVEHVRARWDIEAVLHPHAESHIEHEDQIARFLEDTAEDAVGLCLDVGHHAYCDGDPVQFMRDHHARIPYLHLKSVDGTVRQRAEAEGLSFSQAVALDVFVEPSRGTIDYLELRDALRAVGYAGFGIVEQDMYPAPADKPLPIARRTREYLTQIGFG